MNKSISCSISPGAVDLSPNQRERVIRSLMEERKRLDTVHKKAMNKSRKTIDGFNAQPASYEVPLPVRSGLLPAPSFRKLSVTNIPAERTATPLAAKRLRKKRLPQALSSLTLEPEEPLFIPEPPTPKVLYVVDAHGYKQQPLVPRSTRGASMRKRLYDDSQQKYFAVRRRLRSRGSRPTERAAASEDQHREFEKHLPKKFRSGRDVQLWLYRHRN